MDNASKVAEVPWEGGLVYFFKIDYKSGYLHVPIHEDSRTFLGSFGKISILFCCTSFWLEIKPIDLLHPNRSSSYVS